MTTSPNSGEQTPDPSELSPEDAAALDQLAEESLNSVGDSATADSDAVSQLKTENAELKDRVLRIQAELENFRRRTQKEAADALKYQGVSVIRDMLPGIDNLQRALDVAGQTDDAQRLIDGVRMVAQQFQDALKAHACQPINPEGEPFDPNLHEALTQVPSADHPPMTVLQVVESGYRVHDRMIRPAKVIVSCAPPEAE
ncbi:MAG: nucleotide exchange factor GrpE [Planctomycetaceae bacterium]